jgi:hypothetical protein
MIARPPPHTTVAPAYTPAPGRARAHVCVCTVVVRLNVVARGVPCGREGVEGLGQQQAHHPEDLGAANEGGVQG